jgi:hypothetical protein
MKNIYEVILGCFTVAFISFFMMNANASTYIDYPDGSTYTLKEGERIYITPADLYIKNAYQDGSVHFKRMYPSTKRDTFSDPFVSDQPSVGSHEWCQDYVPWSEGLTFAMVSWQRYCDSNGDDVYDENDDRWEG